MFKWIENSRTRIVYIALSICCMNAAHAGLINDYNLIVFDNLQTTSNIEGRAFVGGNLSGSAVYGTRVTNSSTDSLTVGGNIKPHSNVTIESGNLRLGGNIGPHSNINMHNGQIIQDSSINISPIQTELQLLSQQYSGLTANSTYSLPGSQPSPLTFQAQGSSLAIFDVTEDFFTNSRLQAIDISLNGADTVLFNVSGSSINFTSSGNFVGNFWNDDIQQKILWNFYDATNINFGGHTFTGSVLAPYASLTSYGAIEGSVIANSVNTYGQMHLPTFSGNIEVTPVPAPGALFLGLAGCGALRAYRRRIKA